MCPGIRSCKRAKQDSPGLGFALDEEFYGKPAPAKFKMAVSGCPNCCTDPWMRDLGFIGTDDGFKAVVGGKGGGTPTLARELTDGLTEEQAVTLARQIITFYRENGQALERLGTTIERVGFDTFKDAVL
jgi:NAD(P)H-nitrite reductase large subunit